MIIDFQDLICGKPKPRPRNMVSVVGVRDDHVESVVAAGHLQDHENGSIFAGNGLRHRIGRERIEREESFFEKNRQRPGGGRAKHGSAEKFPPCLQCGLRFHSLGQLKL